MSELRTNFPRAVAGLMCGGLFGGLCAFLAAAASNWLSAQAGAGMPPYLSSVGGFFGAMAFVVVVFLIGLVAVAAPLWALMHRLGRRSMLDAAALGLALGFGGVFAISQGLSALSGMPVVDPAQVWRSAIVMGVICAASALIIWRIAYRRA